MHLPAAYEMRCKQRAARETIWTDADPPGLLRDPLCPPVQAASSRYIPDRG